MLAFGPPLDLAPASSNCLGLTLGPISPEPPTSSPYCSPVDAACVYDAPAFAPLLRRSTRKLPLPPPLALPVPFPSALPSPSDEPCDPLPITPLSATRRARQSFEATTCMPAHRMSGRCMAEPPSMHPSSSASSSSSSAWSMPQDKVHSRSCSATTTSTSLTTPSHFSRPTSAASILAGPRRSSLCGPALADDVPSHDNQCLVSALSDPAATASLAPIAFACPPSRSSSARTYLHDASPGCPPPPLVALPSIF